MASFASAASMVGPATPAFFAASIAGCSFVGSASWNGYGIAALSALSAAAFFAAAYVERVSSRRRHHIRIAVVSRALVGP